VTPGKSERSPTTAARAASLSAEEIKAVAVGVYVEEAQGVLAEDLAPNLVREGDLMDLRWVVEVVMGPVRGEDRVVLAVVELEHRDEILEVLRLLDGLGGEVHLLEVMTRLLG
jgi:hypothetical protein